MQPEEVESFVHEGNWGQLKDRKYLWATWLWVGFDFASTVRHEGDAEDINTKGLITYDRKIRKDAFFFYKANWSGNPTVHITGRRYVDRAYPVTDIKVYSNAPATELLVNGRKIGQLDSCTNRVCTWKSVRLSPGINRIVASGQFAGRKVSDEVTWQLDAGNANAFRIDAGALVAGTSTAGRFGSDNFFKGGEPGSMDEAANFSRPAKPAAIANTPDRAIATTYRAGSFSYEVPLTSGIYRVTLTFVEPSLAPGERIFTVNANGTRAIAEMDIAKEAGAPLTAIERSFDARAVNGLLHLEFSPLRGKALVSAIRIEPVGETSR
jgi:beta-galactosidase